jgi:hypothetical protein
MGIAHLISAWVFIHGPVLAGIAIAILDGYLAGNPNGKWAGLARELIALLKKKSDVQKKET